MALHQALFMFGVVAVLFGVGYSQIVVTGTGTYNTTADTAVIQVGVTTNGTSVAQVVEINAQKVQTVIQQIVDAGIRRDDIQTIVLEFRQLFGDFESGDSETDNTETDTSESSPSDNQWEMTQILSVTARIELLPNVIEEAISGGATSIEGVDFQAKDYTPALQRARVLAVADAQAKAASLATINKVILGKLQTISEPPATVSVLQTEYTSENSLVSLPIAPGTLRVKVSVQLIYAIQ